MEAAIEQILLVIAPRISNAWNLRSNFEKLEREAEVLYSAKADITENIKSSGKVQSEQFKKWSEEAEEIKNHVESIEAELDNKCLNGCCPNVFSCMRLGNEVVGLMDRIPDLKERSQNHDNFMLDPPTPPVETVPAPDIKPGSSIDFTLEEVMGSVRNSDIRKIGIWGMGGVGKTTLMKKLNNLPEIAPMFDVVIWVTVSKDWNIRKVQNEIGQRLSLNLSSEKSDDEVARKIHNKLEKTKYMLLLDDVWDNVNLENVGIPITNSNNGCKIVLTTRSINVCKKMGTNSNIKVKVLSEDEAWELFCEKVGGNIINSPEIQPLARDVAKECAGLPLAVIVVGGALREEAGVHVWRNALEELKSANPSEIEDMEEEVFQRLKFSYDRLNSVNRKRCFLFGALYPEDYEIPVHEVIEYWRASGFLDGSGSLSAAYDRGHAILSHLINASLYEKHVSDEDGECVKMHDVVRDLALRITSMEGNKFFVGTGIESSFPRDEEWKECKGVSLINYYEKQVKLPERPSCPDLSTLILQANWELEVIPESFFVSMTALRVLNLSYSHIKSLPPSICYLVNLCGLYLQECDDLVELPSEIGALERLEFLCVGGGIQYLPMEVGKLTNLRCLRIIFGEVNESSRMQLPKGILSSLSQLEDLRIFVNRRREEQWASNVAEIIEEVCNLSSLNHLWFVFPRLEQFECFIKRNEAWNNGTLASFYFIVNGNFDEEINYRNTFNPNYQDAFDPTTFNFAVVRRLTFENGEGLIPDVIKQVLRRTQCFNLVFHKGIRRLSELGNLNSLTYLYVFDCHKIETTLIYKDCVPAHLETLEVYSCEGVKNVFSQGTIQHLTNLKHLYIYGCKEVSEVISGDAEYSALPSLESLSLMNLPNLERICKQVLAWSSIKEVHVNDCQKLRRLPFGSHNSSTLKEIRCEKGWWDALQWEDDGAKAQLEYSLKFIREPKLIENQSVGRCWSQS